MWNSNEKVCAFFWQQIALCQSCSMFFHKYRHTNPRYHSICHSQFLCSQVLCNLVETDIFSFFKPHPLTYNFTSVSSYTNRTAWLNWDLDGDQFHSLAPILLDCLRMLSNCIININLQAQSKIESWLPLVFIRIELGRVVHIVESLP